MEMVELVYVGKDPELAVPAAHLIAGKGQPFKVTAPVAKNLLKSDDWQLASKAKPAKKAKKAK